MFLAAFVCFSRVHFQADRIPPIDRDRLPYQAKAAAIASQWRETYHFPGVWCAVVKDGRVVACVASGVENNETNAPATTSDHLNVGSISKVVTGSMIAFFVAKGLIRYEDSIADVFPDVARKYPESPLLKATLLQLLTHTSGLPRGSASYRDKTKTGAAFRLAMLEGALRDPSLALPGTKSQYSNVGVCIAAAMVEKVSGRSFESWLEGPEGRQIGLLAPRMLDSYDMSQPNTASPHYLFDGTPRLATLEQVKRYPQYLFEPSGGCSLSIEDLGRFTAFTSSNYNVLPDRAYERIISPEPSDPKQHTVGSWGWHGNSYLTKDGNTGRGEYCLIRVSPKFRLGMVFYANATPLDMEATDGPNGIMPKINMDMANFLKAIQ